MSVFGRVGPHRFDQALLEWTFAGEERSSLAENFRCDDRVSAKRAESLDSFVLGHKPTGDELYAGVRAYYEQRVRGKADPDYLLDLLNQDNRIRLRNLDILLTNVLDLTGLDLVFEWARRDYRFPTFANYPSALGKAFRWIIERMDSLRGSEFLADILKVMAVYGKEVHPFGPVWVTPWTAFEPNLEHGCARWLEVLGMRKARLNLCLVLLTYRARNAGTLYRPTQLDAGPCLEHFPSPARLGAAFGHPVDLGGAPKDSLLLDEMIHGPIDLTDRRLNVSNRAYEAVERNRAPVLGRDSERGTHLRKLEQRYGSEIHAWFYGAALLAG